MPIFDDPKKELARLQRELLEEDENEEEYLTEEQWLEDEIAQAKAMLGLDEEEYEEEEHYRNYANGYGAVPQPADMYDYDDGEEYDIDEEDEELPPKGAGGQMFLTFLLLAGIVAVAMYWMKVLL